ncbi:MAG: T9SS type A sorting domain-containing protein, partial [FCB group bacterium]|nr:T9SS type A sorting domain-containing protein [FCB group bacterium]
LAEDSFPFDKAGVDAGGSINNWNIYGWDGQIAVVSTLPENFELKQNYPNPFNPVTTIEYSLPEAAKVTLTVFNTLGQQAAVLVDGYQQAGYKAVDFEASALSSGIYFYRIEAGDFISMKKMILIK